MTRKLTDSGIAWIGKIPTNWSIMPNKYLMRKKKRICPIYNGEDIISLSMNGVIVRDLDAGGKMPATFDGYQYIENGNLLMCLYDIDVTPRCIGLIKCNGLTSPSYSQFVLTDIADAAYYNYYYTMLDNDKVLVHLAKNLRHSLTEDQLGRIATVVPPIDEQRKIAAFLDEKCSEIDSLIVDIQYEINKLERLRRSVIAEAVTKGLDKNAEMKDSEVIWAPVIPKSWKLLKVKYIMFETKTKADTERAEPLSVTQKYGIIKSSEATVANPSQSYEGYKAVCVDDIVFNKYKAHSGVFFSSTYNGMVTFNYSVYRCYEGNVPKYYEYLFHTDGCIGEFKTKMHGVGESISPLYTKDLFAITVIQPTFADQRRIVEYLDARCAEFDTILSEKQKQLEILQKLKKSVIYEYVTGKKEVK